MSCIASYFITVQTYIHFDFMHIAQSSREFFFSFFFHFEKIDDSFLVVVVVSVIVGLLVLCVVCHIRFNAFNFLAEKNDMVHVIKWELNLLRLLLPPLLRFFLSSLSLSLFICWR